MPLFLYLDRRTFVHQRHPLVKVLGLLLFFIAAFIGTIFIGMVIPIFSLQDHIK